MSRFDGMTEGPLTIERSDGQAEVVLSFLGKSILRDPTEILQPALTQVLNEVLESGDRLTLDFRELKYMNSASFTPIIKALERARSDGAEVSVLFSSDKKWQAVSFAALMIFKTEDGRISIEGR